MSSGSQAHEDVGDLTKTLEKIDSANHTFKDMVFHVSTRLSLFQVPLDEFDKSLGNLNCEMTVLMVIFKANILEVLLYFKCVDGGRPLEADEDHWMPSHKGYVH